MSDKMKVIRIIFCLSFAPYLFLIGYSIYHAIFGYDVYTWILPQYVRIIYGWDAFFEGFFGLLLDCVLFQFCRYVYYIKSYVLFSI